jgi:hypothetical protein
MRRRLAESDMAGGRRGRAGDKYAATSHESLTSVSEIAFLRANLQPPRHDRITIANSNGYGPRDQDGPFLSMTNRLSPRFYYFQVNVTQRLSSGLQHGVKALHPGDATARSSMQKLWRFYPITSQPLGASSVGLAFCRFPNY